MKRIHSLDILKLFAMFLVVWGHAIQEFVSAEPNENIAYRVIYSFHMPLFMMVAGYFASLSLKVNFFQMIVKKGRQLLLPIVSWAAICVLCSFFGLRYMSEHSFPWELNHLLWFLKGLFVCYVFFYIIMKLPHKYHISLIGGTITLIISQLINIYQLPTLYPAFLLGFIISKFRKNFDDHVKPIILISLIIWVIYVIAVEKHWIASIPFSIPMQNRIIEIIGKLSGALLYFSLFSFLFAKESHSKFTLAIGKWGQLTMGIYILQTFILERVLSHLINFDYLSPAIFTFVVSPILSMAIMMICIAIVKIIKLNRYSAFLLLGEKLKPTVRNA